MYILYGILGIFIAIFDICMFICGQKVYHKHYLDNTRINQEENGESMYKIIELRLKEKNMKPCELANKAGISTGTLSDLKSGRLKKPSFELLEKIADVLEMDMNDFRKNEGDKG